MIPVIFMRCNQTRLVELIATNLYSYLNLLAVRYYHRQKKRPLPCDHLDIGALRLPTYARNQAGDWQL